MRTLFETQGQGYVFLLMMYLGLGMGAMDQLLTALWIRRRRVWALLCCGLACSLETVAGVWLLVQTGQESLRFYGVLGILVGWLLYAWGVGRCLSAAAWWIAGRFSLKGKTVNQPGKQEMEHP